MISNVRYRECTCDICGAKQIISVSQVLPSDWYHIKCENMGLTDVAFDACADCSEVICTGFKALIKERHK